MPTQSLLFLMICLMISPASHAQTLDLSKHQWEARLILIGSRSPEHPRVQQQLALFQQATAAMEERRLLVYQLLPNRYRMGWKVDEHWQTFDQLIPEHLSFDADFEILLIGLDGGVKRHQTELLTTEQLFAMIDAMPMRRQELKRRKRSKN